VSQLEHELETQLFERSTRRVALTEAGQKFQGRARALVGEIDDAIRSLKRDESRLEGHIGLLAPTTLTTLLLADVLGRFLREHAHITLEVALVDRSVNPAEEGFDLAISGHSASSYEGVLDLPLHPLEQVLCAAPAYLAQHGTPSHPRDLADHDGLFFKPLGTAWAFETERGQISVQGNPRLLASDNVTLRAAAEAGNGITVLPRYVADAALAAGKLVPLLAGYAVPRAWFRAYVARHRAKLPRIVSLIDWLTTHLGEMLPGAGDTAAPARRATARSSR
jgi:DNA-binding transcriptional LysR family regulator